VRRTLLLMMVAMLVAVMMAVTAGPALAAPGNKGQGAAHANPNASFGISTAIAHSSGCTFSC
jgi:hypothetical protein